MEGYEPKKLALLRILQILQTYSNPEHPLKQEDIAGYLQKDYGIEMERKAIGRNLALLKDAGYEIESDRAGSYLQTREFTDSELQILIDSVLSSQYISEKYSRDLIDKLCSLSSKYFRSHIQYIHTLGDWGKTDNKALFYHIELVDEASKFNFHPTQKGKFEKDGSYTLTFKASGSLEIIWHVFKWGSGCKILAPKSLQAEYKKYLEESLKNY